jgi:hypothetical protein
VKVAYTSAQTAGDLNVVIVGWNDTIAQVNSVSDTAGNVYQLAVGPTVETGDETQSIYYAKNIGLPGSGTNTVSVNFTGTPAYPDIRILEYSGIDPVNPLDVTVWAMNGNPPSSLITNPTSTSSTGTVPTTNAADLLVAANTVGSTTTGPGTGFTQRLLTNPDGDIAEDRIVSTAGLYSATAALTNSNGSWVMQMVAFRSASSIPDTTPPTVSITSPAQGASLSATTSVTVSASDAGTGVAAVQLQIDGIPLGTAATATPYTFSVNPAKFTNGAHTLTASAWDFANNIGSSSPVSVNFVSTANPAQSGAWSGTTPLPIVVVNAALLPNNNVLMYDGQSFGTTAIVWNYATNTFDSVPVPANIFCSGQEQMADGLILVVGGHIASHVGLPAANIFNPVNNSWTVAPNMSWGRWYPTATMLSTGSLIVTSGETDCDECDEKVQEIYNPATNSWSQLSSAPFFFPYYPHIYQLPDGRVLAAATAEAPIVSEVLDLNALTWTAVGGTATPDGGSSAMYLPSKFLKTGTSTDPDDTVQPSANTAYVLDMTQGTPAWRQVASMAFARTFHNTTVLPDGNVLITGGGPTTNATDTANAILPAELWSPTTQTWTTLSSMSAPRLYHSEALLLPDGRVLISGGGRFDDDTAPTDQFSAEFFEPPYLFKGTRPAISSAPSQLVYGQNFTVQTPDAARIGSVSLIRFGAVTHAFNVAQRFIPLTFAAGSNSLNITAPVNASLAPAGNYMLFIVDTNGIPSVAAIVHF